MGVQILLRAGAKRSRGTMAGLFLFMAAAAFSMTAVLSLWLHSSRYLNEEIRRSGFGALTVWVSGVPEETGTAGLAAQVQNLPQIRQVTAEDVIYTNYEIRDQESDSEGQLLRFRPEEKRYRFFTEDLSGYREMDAEIGSGEVYVSPSMVSMFGLGIGDTVEFPIARNGGTLSLTVAGFYEDPYMGSSMIGMKGFLVGGSEFEQIEAMIRDAGIDGLARSGAMLHIDPEEGQTGSAAELAQTVTEQTEVSAYLEFSRSQETMLSFMLVLQTAYCGIFLAFVLVLLLVADGVLGYSVSGAIEMEWKDIGRLRALGWSSRSLRAVFALPYLASVTGGLVTGMTLAVLLGNRISGLMVTTIGVRVPAGLPGAACILALGIVLGLISLFCLYKTRAIPKITPMEAVRGEMQPKPGGKHRKKTGGYPALWPGILSLSLAFRQLLSGRRRYLAAGVTALLLVFFASLVGHINSWLGPEGQGMMDAFNPADHDLGVQAMGQSSIEEMEALVRSYTAVTDSYELAMPSVSVEGVPYTANVITEPERFHILSGETSREADEIVITETVAADRNLAVGDTLTVSGDSGSASYRIAGIYQCANDMGDNIGMSREGYQRIGQDEERLWCHHLFLEDISQKGAVIKALEDTYGGDVHVHENSWPGLYGIIGAMKVLLAVMYGAAAGVILMVTILTGSKIIRAEQRELGIYKAMGFGERRLRLLFVLRFTITAGIGAAAGGILAAALSDPLTAALMRYAGISSFSSALTAGNTLFPAAAVVLCFAAFAWIASGRIKRIELAELVTE